MNLPGGHGIVGGPSEMGRPRSSSLRALAAATLGSALEYYDFATFTFFAVFIGRTYFPSDDPFASLMLSLGTLAAGFLMRPLGGALIGRFADRAGRRKAMLLTIMLMTIGTMGIAMTPSYAAIGMAAPIIVVIARMVQGIAVGGEVGTATAFVVEIAPPGRRNLYVGILQGASGLGTVVAGVTGAAVATWLPERSFGEWGWRLPFLIGLLALPAGLYIRRHLPESLTLSTEQKEMPVTSLRPYGMAITLAVLAIGSMSISVYVSYYMTTYALTVLQLPASTSIAVAIASGIASIVGCALATLADHIGERPLLIVPRLALITLAYPLFALLLYAPGLPLLMLTAGTIMLLQAMSINATLAIVSQRFPATIRSTAMGLSFATGASLLGGTTQIVAAWLTHVTGDPAATALYLIAANVVGLAAVLLLERNFSVVSDAISV